MSPLPGAMPEAKQLRRARYTARKRGLAATLSLHDWHQTCADQEYCCAYCGKDIIGDGTIDHFLPLASGSGGSTVANCLLSCQACNQRKGAGHPTSFLASDPETLARCWIYLTQRTAGQKASLFWRTFPAAHHKEPPMNFDEMNHEERQITTHSLSSGMTLSLLTDEQQIVLQLHQQALPENDPLVTSFRVATRLTPSECLRLAATLLQAASAKVEQVSTQPSASPWDLRAS